MFKAPQKDEVTRIISHKGCADGIASALILRACYPDASVQFVQYEHPNQKELDPNKGIAIFCDITPHPSNAKAFADAGHYCLDHHKTGREIVELFGDRGLYASEEEGLSGAGLALKVLKQVGPVYGRVPQVEDMAELACIYDTWQRDHERWDEASAQANYFHFIGEERAMNRDTIALTKEERGFARVLQERHLENAQRALEERISRISDFGVFQDNHDGRLVNEVADLSRKRGHSYKAIVGYTVKPVGFAMTQCKFSLRRVRSDFDCAKASKESGGGGHSGAGAFSKNLSYTESPLSVFALEAEKWL